MMLKLLEVVPDLPAGATVASFLAETDNVTRTLKGYSDTLDGRPESARQCTIQAAQVFLSASFGQKYHEFPCCLAHHNWVRLKDKLQSAHLGKLQSDRHSGL